MRIIGISVQVPIISLTIYSPKNPFHVWRYGTPPCRADKFNGGIFGMHGILQEAEAFNIMIIFSCHIAMKYYFFVANFNIFHLVRGRVPVDSPLLTPGSRAIT